MAQRRPRVSSLAVGSFSLGDGTVDDFSLIVSSNSSKPLLEQKAVSQQEEDDQPLITTKQKGIASIKEEVAPISLQTSGGEEEKDHDSNHLTASELVEQEPASSELQKSTSFVSKIAKEKAIVFKRAFSSFLRVADLGLHEKDSSFAASLHSLSTDEFSDDYDDEDNDVLIEDCYDYETATTTSCTTGTASSKIFPNYHHMSVDPPPGVDLDPKERWIVLDNGNGEHSPIAPLAVNALARSGLTSTFDQSMWTPDAKTGKLLLSKHHCESSWFHHTWQSHGNVCLSSSSSSCVPNEKDVMIWTGGFRHGLYGSELPVVRSAGMIPASPRALMELLVDSDRVKEYNKLSLGRDDIMVLQADLANGPFGGITKVMKSSSRPPLVRKTLQFTSILHVRELPDASGYQFVTRAVTLPNENHHHPHNSSSGGSASNSSTSLKSEILMGVNVIKRIEGQDNKCMLITVNHIRSPMVPMMIAKRIGVQAAANFILDLQQAFLKK